MSFEIEVENEKEYSYDDLMTRFKVLGKAGQRLVDENKRLKQQVDEAVNLADEMAKKMADNSRLTASRIQANNEQINELVQENQRLNKLIEEYIEKCR